ncbi:Outer membrane lipoprotein Omp16 [bacterium HR40]|nr:Outer membrane lipoprotein Omp16 [bacterium HR40]
MDSVLSAACRGSFGHMRQGTGPRRGRYLLLALLLASCALPESSLPPAVEWPAAPRAELVEMHHTVRFATDSDRLTPVEQARLVAFLDQLPSRPAGHVRVAAHADARGTRAYNLDLAARRARAVADAIRAHTGAETAVDLRSFGEGWPLAPGDGEEAWARNRRAEVTVKVAVIRIAGCEPATPASGFQLDNGPYAGLGCATARNLAAMLAAPSDLAAPSPVAPAFGDAAAAAVGRYREGKVTPLLDAAGGAP